MKKIETIINYYNKCDEEPRLVRTKANILEFETTKYPLKDYIKKGDTILETGAATGRYSFHYSKSTIKLFSFTKTLILKKILLQLFDTIT